MMLVPVLGLVGCDSNSPEEQSIEGNHSGLSVNKKSKESYSQSSRNKVRKRELTRNRDIHPLVKRMDSIIVPLIHFENTTVEEAIDFLRIRQIEVEYENDEKEKGVSFVVRKPKFVGGANDNLDKEAAGLLGVASDSAAKVIPSLYAENISLMDAVYEIVSASRLDAYLTSHGFMLLPEGSDPASSLRKGAEILKVIRATEAR